MLCTVSYSLQHTAYLRVSRLLVTGRRDKWACQWPGCVMSDKLLTSVHACYYTKTDEDSSQEAPSTEPVANSPPQLLR